MADPVKKDNYVPLAALSNVTIAVFGWQALISLCLTILGLAYVLFHRDPFSPDESGPLALLFALLDLATRFQPLALVGGVVAFLCWIYYAYRNLGPLLARNLAFSAGWAVGAWFVPFASLVVPFMIMREIWHGSDPELEENNRITRERAGTPDLLVFWWLAFLVSGLAVSISNLLAASQSADAVAAFPGILTASQVLRGGAVVLLILIVREITNRQRVRYQRRTIGRASELPPRPPKFEATFGEEPNAMHEPSITAIPHSMPDEQERQHEQPHAGHEVPIESYDTGR